MERIIDLHIHTNLSDGAFSPKEVIELAKNNNLSTIAIADHDSTMAYTTETFDFAEKNNITLIPAVEMSTRYAGVGIHVLGYNINLNNNELQETLSNLRNARQNYLLDVSKKLNELGYIVDVEKLKTAPSVTKAHISADIVSNEKNKDLLIKTFGFVPDKGTFIETIMNEGCPAFVEKFSISPIKASEIIKNAGGKVILAHPVAYVHEDNLNKDIILEMLTKMKADGIESNYIYVNRNNEIIDETKMWNSFAKEHNLLVTIGSDFHNFDGIRPEIGLINTSLRLNNNQIEEIVYHISKKDPV